MSATSATTPSTDGLDRRSISGIDIAEIADRYRSSGLDRWSDARLVDAVAALVAEARQGPSDSFVLHAPLELGARARLLPLVAPHRRHLARLHIVAVAAQYETYEPAPDVAQPQRLPTRANPAAWLTDSLRAGDIDEVDRAAGELAASTTPHELVAALADVIIPLTAAAAHGPIFLYHLSRLAPVSGYRAQMLRPLARQLARNPERRISWTDGWTPAANNSSSSSNGSSGELQSVLASVPLLGAPGSTMIDPLITQVDNSTDITAMLAASVGEAGPRQAKAILRTAAQSMLLDTADRAPYGWTHCLTMPQAVLGLTSFSADPDLAHAVAATHVSAFRAGLGKRPLAPADDNDNNDNDGNDGNDGSGRSSLDPTVLATMAATSHDAHVAKYVLGCLDAAQWDREAAALYLRAARRLLDVWAANGGDPTDPLAAER